MAHGVYITTVKSMMSMDQRTPPTRSTSVWMRGMDEDNVHLAHAIATLWRATLLDAKASQLLRNRDGQAACNRLLKEAGPLAPCVVHWNVDDERDRALAVDFLALKARVASKLRVHVVLSTTTTVDWDVDTDHVLQVPSPSTELRRFRIHRCLAKVANHNVTADEIDQLVKRSQALTLPAVEWILKEVELATQIAAREVTPQSFNPLVCVTFDAIVARLPPPTAHQPKPKPKRVGSQRRSKRSLTPTFKASASTRPSSSMDNASQSQSQSLSQRLRTLRPHVQNPFNLTRPQFENVFGCVDDSTFEKVKRHCGVSSERKNTICIPKSHQTDEQLDGIRKLCNN